MLIENELDVLNTNDASMDDLKLLVDNIINEPLNNSINSHIDDLKWSIENFQNELLKSILTRSEKKELKKLSEDSENGFDEIKEVIENQKNIFKRSLDSKTEAFENSVKILHQEAFQVAENNKNTHEKNLEHLKIIIKEGFLKIGDDLKHFENMSTDQSEMVEEKFQLMQKKIDDVVNDFKGVSLQYSNHQEENKKVYFILIALNIVFLVLLIALIYIKF
ncbi:hypothetical protein [Acinetobacter sp. ANC 4178]|uniref:hypothetical protein n=1 Tax=Acinetobacter sp. ANC 4178 TaxID=2529839 RepID=UPI001039403F|nr:hypothetical protein [Acinetobacter sp. ANC 4178]TCB67506.1 hypothetical protein E0H87_04730 [Acinetobacter sp. ANC 4178]